MDEQSELVTVANYRVWDLAAGLWRYPLRKAVRTRIFQVHGVPLHDTEEDVPCDAIDFEGWYVPRDGREETWLPPMEASVRSP